MRSPAAKYIRRYRVKKRSGLEWPGRFCFDGGAARTLLRHRPWRSMAGCRAVGVRGRCERLAAPSRRIGRTAAALVHGPMPPGCPPVCETGGTAPSSIQGRMKVLSKTPRFLAANRRLGKTETFCMRDVGSMKFDDLRLCRGVLPDGRWNAALRREILTQTPIANHLKVDFVQNLATSTVCERLRSRRVERHRATTERVRSRVICYNSARETSVLAALGIGTAVVRGCRSG